MNQRWNVYLLGHDLRKPLIQMGAIAILAIATMVVLWVIYPTQEASWMIGASAMLLFTIFNTVSSVFRENWLRYTLKSFACFVAMAILLFILSGLLSIKGFGSPNVYHTIFVLFLAFFIMASVLAGLIHQLMSFLEKIDS
jgi:predicted ferric reductase